MHVPLFEDECLDSCTACGVDQDKLLYRYERGNTLRTAVVSANIWAPRLLSCIGTQEWREEGSTGVLGTNGDGLSLDCMESSGNGPHLNADAYMKY